MKSEIFYFSGPRRSLTGRSPDRRRQPPCTVAGKSRMPRNLQGYHPSTPIFGGEESIETFGSPLARRKLARSRRRPKSATVGGDGLDSRRWRSDRSEGRLGTCPASPKEPIATFFLLDGGRKRKGEGGGGGVVARSRERKKKRKKECRFLDHSGSIRTGLV
ncbi:hypothetical protein JCGZ_17069 [Jatropha curcas]|uniref:Uncharacterized protein n=1 Tax=Jatropha curcas TaxID=180498 RepID=A0A067LAL7_JATCU|nr:hypothetical protein JCGZ_17069 [Jatropha curcas]